MGNIKIISDTIVIASKVISRRNSGISGTINSINNVLNNWINVVDHPVRNLNLDSVIVVFLRCPVGNVRILNRIIRIAGDKIGCGVQATSIGYLSFSRRVGSSLNQKVVPSNDTTKGIGKLNRVGINYSAFSIPTGFTVLLA